MTLSSARIGSRPRGGYRFFICVNKKIQTREGLYRREDESTSSSFWQQLFWFSLLLSSSLAFRGGQRSFRQAPRRMCGQSHPSLRLYK
jgi:hypothetical protein